MSLQTFSYRKALSSETLTIKKDIDHYITFDILELYKKLLTSKKKPKYVTLLIDSLGGDVDAMVNFKNIMAKIQSLDIKIVTVCIGAARSAAFDIFMQGDIRASMPAPNFMTHTAYLVASPMVQFRDKQVRKMDKELKECEDLAPLSPEVKFTSAQQALYDINEEVEMNYKEAVLANVVNTELI